MAIAQARLPTYKTAARVLEGEKGSGLALLGWTFARTLLIAPPFMLVGNSAKQAFLGAFLASGLISIFTVLRLFNAQATGLQGLKGAKCLALQGSRRRRRR